MRLEVLQVLVFLIVVMVLWAYAYVRTLQIIYFKYLVSYCKLGTAEEKISELKHNNRKYPKYRTGRKRTREKSKLCISDL